MQDDIAISLSPATSSDLNEIDDIFDDLTNYSLCVDGVSRRRNAAHEFLNTLPPGFEPRHKYAFLAKRGGAAVGLLDIVNGYPSHGTAFIGLLAVRENAQGLGIGAAIFREGERIALHGLKATTLRLAVVETNPVIGFWRKMGFSPTGEVKPFEGKTIRSRSVLMEKRLLDLSHNF
ncbi:GNAT family N-acetyltransferase [Methylosinus sp. PW1]|uniref:GNAT family N-acetyltransferase n=1 Tax=Methylosinus sp. PW1 TaxID=107636 RepID=UPI0006911ABC|nr:GNAT family N-acetyltransferase [Methylosinus sp. PW1]